MYRFKAGVCGFLFIVSVLSVIISSTLAIVSVSRYFNAEKNSIAIVFLFSGIALGLIYLSKYFKRRRSYYLSEYIDNTILQFAIEAGGMVTASELAAKTSFGMNEASEYLERHHMSGFCEKKFTEDLVPVYHFAKKLSHDEKKRSVDILDI